MRSFAYRELEDVENDRGLGYFVKGQLNSWHSYVMFMSRNITLLYGHVCVVKGPSTLLHSHVMFM